MVKVKLNSFSEKSHDFVSYEGERLSETFDRFYKDYEFEVGVHEQYFKIFINGQEVEKELWAYIKPKENAEVLIALFPKSGDTGRILGQVAVVVATLAVSSPSTAAFVAIAGGFLVNQLFPPPGIDLGGATKGYQQEDSQMYNITGQSNQLKKYGYVPKVYGTHRIFPNVAANPYTEFEVKNGELTQFLFAVYDLGYGPMVVNDIKIGDTQIELFEDVYYRLVDFNKPSADEGSWDTSLSNVLGYYKGDNSSENVGAVISSNQNDPGVVVDDYTVIRNADENVDQLNNQVSLDFSFPQGLTTYGTNGKRLARNVELEVQFAEVGTEDWHDFNDLNQVSSFNSAGNFSEVNTNEINFNIKNQRTTEFGYQIPGVVQNMSGELWNRFLVWFDVLSSNQVTYPENIQYAPQFPGYGTSTNFSKIGFVDRYGYKKNTKIFYSSTTVNVNDYITHGGDIVGKIKTRVIEEGSIYKYTLYSGFPYDIYLFTDFVQTDILSDYDGSIRTFRSYYLDFNHTRKPVADPPLMTDKFKILNGSGIFRISANKQTALYASVKFTPNTTNQIKIRVKRIRSYGGYSYRILDEMVWNTISTRFDRDPIVTDFRHVFLEVKIRATDQINGVIKNLSAVCSSVLDYYDPNDSSWKKKVSANPAWVYTDLITGDINKRALSKTRLDVDSLVEWADFCDQVPTPPPGRDFQKPRFESNFISDTNITVAQLITQITSSAQASMNMVNGRYGVLVDKLKTVPVQLFTPRNSWGFSSTRTYAEPPDAITVKYVDPSKEWGVYEEFVYDEGKDASNAINFEELDSFACTNFEQAWRFGRYFQVSSRLRQEDISLQVDFEHLVCTRGDFVKIQQDVMKVGGRPSRVKSVSGAIIIIDDDFITEFGVDYGYTFRGVNGIFSGTMDITDVDTATLTGDLPSVGDLLVWGEVDKITIDCLVKTITPNDDLSATLTLIEKADEVYDAESTNTLPFYDPKLITSVDADTEPPSAIDDFVVTDNTYSCGNGSYDYYIQLDWAVPIGSVSDKHEVYVDRGSGYKLVDFAGTITYSYIVDEDFLGIEHSFKVIGVAANGSKLNLVDVPTVQATPLAKTDPPSDVQALYINILNESLQVDWDMIPECGIENYLIRYSPNVSSSWASSVPLQVVDSNTSLATFQARVGTYFIKAVDWAGNESANAARAITSIPDLVNINIIEETNDFPGLLGSLDQVQVFGSELILQEKATALPGAIEYFEDGYYYYKDLLDLGEIYTVRIQSLIEAEGFSVDDLMSSWVSLSDVDFLSGASVSDWDIETQYRATNNFNVMSEWVDMASIDPIGEGVQDDFTDWRKFTIGDFTGRVFQFRLKLISNNPSVTPRVFDGIIKADMPDRVESYNDLVTTSGEYSLSYALPFKGPGTSPNIQVTQDAAQQGDYYQIDNKTLEGFTIKFYDNTNTLVDRQFDILVKGYGRKQNAVI